MIAKHLRLRRRIWVPAAVAVGFAVATLGPIGDRPDFFGNADLDRLIGFVVAGIALGVAFPRHRAWSAVGLLILAGALEMAQSLAPGRHPALSDFLVKLLGGAVGLAAVAASEWPSGAGRYSPMRVAVAGSILLLGLGGMGWWLRAPLAAARAFHAQLLADRQRIVVAIGRDPGIDIWDHARDDFSTTIRRKDCTGPSLVVDFERHGLSWRPVRSRNAAARSPALRHRCNAHRPGSATTPR